MTSTWVLGANEGLFGLEALPYGVAAHKDGSAELVVRIGDQTLPLAAAGAATASDHAELFNAGLLDPLMAAGPRIWAEVRAEITTWLSDDSHRERLEPLLRPVDAHNLRLPFTVADYVDFYSSEAHATNVGRIFRPDQAPLTPNWKHLPIGYHGRSGSVVVSGTDVVRPSGQRKAPADAAPTFGPSRRLDIEAEVGFVVGVGSELGRPVDVSAFVDHVFGVVLVNDWSARDIQSWEYVPLGPFLGKSFATSMSAWVLPLAALHAARTVAPTQDPPVLPYLRDDRSWGLDLTLEVEWNGTVISRPPFAEMYWTPPQQLAHLTVNGAPLRTGDLLASGTVSGQRREQRGSFLELTWSGTEPVELADGSTRTFLEDGDTVVIRASAPGFGGTRIGLGEVVGRIRATR
ncbi:MAG TPA: fumarylacetoacetase [Jatrophihabitantaceae bacterium]|nr:fumarylacetoacetase [Jatrophihabitantaceae bacterium]